MNTKYFPLMKIKSIYTRFRIVPLFLVFYFFSPVLTSAYSQLSDSSFVLSSPYHTVYNHLKYLKDESYDPERSALSFDQPGFKQSEKVRLAIKLKQVLDVVR